MGSIKINAQNPKYETNIQGHRNLHQLILCYKHAHCNRK